MCVHEDPGMVFRRLMSGCEPEKVFVQALLPHLSLAKCSLSMGMHMQTSGDTKDEDEISNVFLTRR